MPHHGILMDRLSRRFKEKTLPALFGKILATYHTAPGKGVPIGNLISQHLANFYLGIFDHWINEDLRIKGYVRYMDDCILFSAGKNELEQLLDNVHHSLADHPALTVKDNVQINRTMFGVPFLGFRVCPAHTRMLPRTRKRFSRKLREYEMNVLDGRWSGQGRPEKER